MDMKTLLLRLLAVVPQTVLSVEQEFSTATGKTKQQIAKDVLLISAGTAAAIDPGDVQTIVSVGKAVEASIDSTVSLFNSFKVFTHKADKPSTENVAVASVAPAVAINTQSSAPSPSAIADPAERSVE